MYCFLHSVIRSYHSIYSHTLLDGSIREKDAYAIEDAPLQIDRDERREIPITEEKETSAHHRAPDRQTETHSKQRVREGDMHTTHTPSTPLKAPILYYAH